MKKNGKMGVMKQRV